MCYFASCHSLFQAGVTFISSGHMKWLVIDPQQLLHLSGEGLVWQQGCFRRFWSVSEKFDPLIWVAYFLVSAIRLVSFVIFFSFSSTTSWEQVMLREHWTRSQCSKGSEINSPTGLFLGLEGRSLGVQAVFFTFLSLMLSVIPWPLLLVQEKGVPHLPCTAQRVKKAQSQNERRSRKRKINSWVIA